MKTVCCLLISLMFAVPVQATGCYSGGYGYNYGYHYPSYNYSYSPPTYYYSYPIYQVSYAPDPDTKLKELKLDLEKQILQTQAEVSRTKLDFVQYQFEQYKRAYAMPDNQPPLRRADPYGAPAGQPAPAPPAPANQQPANQQPATPMTPMPPAETKPEPKDEKKEDKTALQPHPAASCMKCHDKGTAARDGGGHVAFEKGKLVNFDFAKKAPGRIYNAKRPMPPNSHFTDDEKNLAAAPFIEVAVQLTTTGTVQK